MPYLIIELQPKLSHRLGLRLLHGRSEVFCAAGHPTLMHRAGLLLGSFEPEGQKLETKTWRDPRKAEENGWSIQAAYSIVVDGRFQRRDKADARKSLDNVLCGETP